MIHYMTTQGVGDAWIGNELRILDREGVPYRLNALHRPQATFFLSDDISAKDAATHYIYPLGPFAMLAGVLLAPLRFGGRFWQALANALTGPRESLRVRAKCLWHLFVACVWAGHLRTQDVSAVHSQWIHSGGTVAFYAAWLIDKPFSFTGHAVDLFRMRSALSDKIAHAKHIICISEFHRQFYLEHGARPEQLQVVYCGIDTTRFAPPPAGNRSAASDFHLVASGRLVEKKGFKYAIEACRLLLDEGLSMRLTIAGSGPLEAELREQVRALGLDDQIQITGEALMQEKITELMHSADAYCLPCVWASDDDVDGLPQMLMEAMACGVPAVSTRLVGIPDLVIDEETGLLAPPEDAVELAACIRRIHDDPELARRFAAAGRQHVLEHFDLRTCLQPLIEIFNAELDRS